MFAREIYIKRRSDLKTKTGNGLILLLGNDLVGMNYSGNHYRFRQDSTFLYYTGLDIPGISFIIDVDNNKELLFGDDPTLDDVIWTGPLEPLQQMAERSGIRNVLPCKKIADVIKDAQLKNQPIYFLPPYRGTHVLKLSEWLGSPVAAVEKAFSVGLIKAIVSMRSYKQPEEIVEMDKAADMSVVLQELFLTTVKPGMKETELSGQIEGRALSLGGNIAYPVILTEHGETLHIHAHNTALTSCRLALCDAGAETAMHYAGDLTRTKPVNGKFTTSQKEIYEIVLQSQLAAIEACKPGVLFRDVHALACKKLLEGLRELGIIKGAIEEAFAEDVHTLFFQCGLGHMIGLDVHDMENLGEQYVGYDEQTCRSPEFGWKSLRLAKTLHPGFTLTIEPGIYFIPLLINKWMAEKKCTAFINYNRLLEYKDFGGIRIEDELLITENGYRLLGASVANKTVSGLEAM